jgi:hypothetical protein
VRIASRTAYVSRLVVSSVVNLRLLLTYLAMRIAAMLVYQDYGEPVYAFEPQSHGDHVSKPIGESPT